MIPPKISIIVKGLVEHGLAQARDSGYPTANLSLETLPDISQGTYLGFASIEKEEKIPSIIFFGIPYILPDITVPRFEVHLLEQNADLYGRQLTVELTEFVRENQKFSNQESLERAIESDFKIAKKYFKAVIPDSDRESSVSTFNIF